MSTSATNSPPPKPPKVQRPPPPLPPPSFVLNNPFTAALYDMFSKQGSTVSIDKFCSLLSPDLMWKMPIFDARTRKEVYDSWIQFFSFAIDSTIVIYSVTYKDDSDDDAENAKCYTFEWTFSFLYPLPWRPRVSISGQSIITTGSDTQNFVTDISDDWYVQPISLVRQALPKLKDIFWLFPAPPAESDLGTRRQLSFSSPSSQKRKRSYTIIEQAPRAELSVYSMVEEHERELVYVTPILPPDVFEGRLKRREFYSTITPLSVRYSGAGDEFEFMVPLPSGHVGSANVLIGAPLAEGVTIKSMPKRVFAIYRFSGFSTRENAEVKLKELMKWLREDGLWQGDVLANDVWVRSYDATVGFNSRGLLAITMYGNSVGVPRVNEVAIDITENWNSIQNE